MRAGRQGRGVRATSVLLEGEARYLQPERRGLPFQPASTGLTFGSGAGTSWLRLSADLSLGLSFLQQASGQQDAAGRPSGAMLGAECSLQGRQGALPAHGSALQPQNKGPGCPGLRAGGPALWPRPPVVSQVCAARRWSQARAHPPAPSGPWSCLQSLSFLCFHPSRVSLSQHFFCISPLPHSSASQPLPLHLFCTPL